MSKRSISCLVVALASCGHQESADPHSPSGSASAHAIASASASAPIPAPAPSRPPPACAESFVENGPFPAPSALAKSIRGEPGALGFLEQTWEGKRRHLRFFGAHLFDLLDKIVHEGGASENEKRKVICTALDEMGKHQIPVLRIWGSLKMTGSMAEIDLAGQTLALVLDENARRRNPLRFVITLQNHQAGYGAPDSTRSLDDQEKLSPYFSRRFYLDGGWRETGKGSLADRIDAYAARKEIKEDTNIIGFELVNELDTFRHIASGSFEGPDADALIQSFAVPALSLLAQRFPQPVLLGDMRGHKKNYLEFHRRLVEAFPQEIRNRLVWTTHVYTTFPSPARQGADEPFTWKLNLDLALARALGLPLLMGEIGQHIALPGKKPSFCQARSGHDLGALFSEVLTKSAAHPERGDMEMALLWGEGLCALPLPDNKRISIGAGGDSADIGSAEEQARALLLDLRGRARFRPD